MFNKITNNTVKKICSATSILALTLGLANTASATIVEFQTSQGNFQVNLFDTTTPATVNNFLNYVNDEHYTDSVVHRAAPGFVVQAGGFKFSGTMPFTPLQPNSPVANEPVYSNVKGTIAMAKINGDINSATNQWFFNLTDSSSNLDVTNGGFTVFGQVIGDGMTIVEKIANLPLCNATIQGGIPMVMDDGLTCDDLSVPGMENFVVIEQIVIVDSSEATDANLSPTKNTLLNVTPEDSGGSFSWFALVMIGLVTARRRLLSI